MNIPSLLSQIMRFLCAGGIGVLLYYIILLTFTELFGVWYLISAIVGSIANYSSNFILHKWWTFKNKDSKRIIRQTCTYFTLSVARSFANLGLLYLLVDYAGLRYLNAQVILTLMLSLISFIVSRKIFRK